MLSYLFQTMAMSYLAAFASVFYAVEVVLIALGMTSIVTITISFIATFTKVYKIFYLDI